MDQKKPRKTEKRQMEIVRQLRPIDDCFFEVMMEDPDACEELLRISMYYAMEGRSVMRK